MNHTESLQELSFDFYERYILLERIEKLFRPADRPYRVLDVGGHTEAFWPGFPSMAGTLVPDSFVTVVDVIPQADLRNYVRASGMQLPFRDGTFDLVCSLDTLEHIPAEARPVLLAELLRVTRNGLYMAFPYNSAGNRWAESMVTGYTEASLHNPIPALLEHRQFGLPDRDAVTAFFEGSSYPMVSFGQGNTDIWLLMMMTYHTLRIAGDDFVQELNRRFNQVYAGHDWAPPTYRSGYILSKCGAAADLEALRDSFAGAPKSADLQGVLAFCQLYLNIAQNARVVADKDRHIANIERENGQVSELARANRAGIESLQRQVQSLERTNSLNLDGQARLDERLREAEIGLLRNKRAVQAIYDSRIWMMLAALGGLMLRLMGRAPEPQAAAPADVRTTAPLVEEDPPPPSVTGEYMELTSDHPGTRVVLPVRDLVEIRGWALAQSGIARILVQINDDPPQEATYGVLREDVALEHPQVLGAERSGYRFFWDTVGMPDGPYKLRITAEAKSGEKRLVVCRVIVDQKMLPGYNLWIMQKEPSAEEKERMKAAVEQFAVRPKISIAVPVYRTPIPVLTRCIESVIAQLYPNWELCLADDASGDSAITALLEDYARRDPRIRFVTLERNRRISGATNAALRLATGGYAAFLDHDDEIADFALWEVVRGINEHPGIDLFYSDEDKIDEHGRRYDAFFKPDWSPELFLSYNYICHFVVVKRELLDKLGGLDENYSGSQDYDFLLRASEQTQKIKRIPKILYHWRAVEGSTAMDSIAKPQASEDGRRAIAAHLARTRPGAQVDEVSRCRYHVHYPIVGNPRVTILMPTGGNMTLLRTAIEDVLRKTAYKNYDILVIDNSRASAVAEYAASLADRRAPVRYLDWRNKPFNFSQMNNVAARNTDAPYILFLNDDMTIITEEWLGAMLEHAQRPEVGAVGAQLWYPNNLIQHAGVVMGIYGNSGHAFKGMLGGREHYFDFPNVIRNYCAVTAACLLVSRAKFFEAGAFDETNLPVAFQDVDLCLKLVDLGYRNVYTPYARLYHHESVTKAEKVPNPVEDGFMKRKWQKYIADDPCYNPNLARRTEDFRIEVE